MFSGRKIPRNVKAMATGEAPTAAATEVATTEQPDFVKTIQATVRILSSFSLLD